MDGCAVALDTMMPGRKLRVMPTAGFPCKGIWVKIVPMNGISSFSKTLVPLAVAPGGACAAEQPRTLKLTCQAFVGRLVGVVTWQQ